MQSLRVFGWIFVLACLSACASAGVPRAERWPAGPPANHLSMTKAVTFVNAIRERHGLPYLVVDTRLMNAAARQAQYQSAVQNMSHYGHRGATLDYRLDLAGYQFSVAGENVSRGRQTERDAVAAWMRSPPHKRVILHPQATEIGVAASLGPRGQVYWSLVVADPAPMPQKSASRRRVVFW